MNKTKKVITYMILSIVVIVVVLTAYDFLWRSYELRQIKQAYTVTIPQDLQLIRHEQERGASDAVPHLLDSYRPERTRPQTYKELASAFKAAGYTVEGDGNVFTNVINHKKGLEVTIDFYTTINKLGNDDNGSGAVKQIDILVEKT